MKAWKWVIIAVVLVGAGVAAYFFVFKKKKSTVAPSIAKQLQPTTNYVPQTYTVAPTMSGGSTKAVPAQQFLSGIGAVAQKAGEKVVSKVAEQAASKIGDVASNAVNNLFASWGN